MTRRCYVIIVIHVIISLAAPVGNMKQILCSDWLTGWATWAHPACSGLPALTPLKERLRWNGLAKFATIEQCRRCSPKKWQKTVKQRKQKTLLGILCCNSCVSFPAFKFNISFLSLFKAKSFSSTRNSLLVGLFGQDGWIWVLLFYFVFMDLNVIQVHKNAEKTSVNMHFIVVWPLLFLQNEDLINNVYFNVS